MATTSPILQMVTTRVWIIMLKRNINIPIPFDWWSYGLIYFFLNFFVVKFVMTRWILTLKNNRFLLFNEFPAAKTPIHAKCVIGLWSEILRMTPEGYWYHENFTFFVATVLAFLFSLSPTKDKLIGTFNHETDYSHLPNNISSLPDLKDKIKALAC